MTASIVIALVLLVMAIAFAVVLNAWTAVFNRQESSDRVSGDMPRVTIIVPARNEERNVAAVLQDLYAQDHPRTLMEVILVDDASEDRTRTIASGMARSWPELRVLAATGTGKKAAIAQGVSEATGDLIVLTDCDVRCGPTRVSSIVQHWMATGSQMIVLPVITQGDGLLGSLQANEQLALTGVAMGAAGEGTAVLAYGANLAFTRQAFLQVGGYTGDGYASGDDMFLLQRMQAQGFRITAHTASAASVTTAAAPTFRQALEQRMRWAGKMRGMGAGSLVRSGGVLFFPWLMLWATCYDVHHLRVGAGALYTFGLLVSAWAVWSLPIVALVRAVRLHYGVGGSTISTLLALAAFSIYAPLIGAASLFIGTRWKGRRI